MTRAFGSLDSVPGYTGDSLDTSKNSEVVIQAIVIEEKDLENETAEFVSIVTNENECLAVKDGYLSNVLRKFASVYEYPVTMKWAKKGKSVKTVV